MSSLSSTPAAERVHISFFGCTNAGKSSLINALTNQKLSIVSDVAGTTTDPVVKTMEFFPLGPCVITDTAGIDDKSELGSLRMEKTKQVLGKTDVAVIVIAAKKGKCEYDEKLIADIKARNIPYIVCYNKCDEQMPQSLSDNELATSAKTGEGVEKLRIMLGSIAADEPKKHILKDLVKSGETVLLVIPIDESAPKGRLILPQQQVMRELLENGNIVMAVQDTEVKDAISHYGDRISLVITDSQAFRQVAKDVPGSIPLTSFSILFMRYKGELETAVDAVRTLDSLLDGDRILISEGCTHHRQCNDIGSVKIPKLVEHYTGKNLIFEHTSGVEFAHNPEEYKLIIHCGACMLNEKEIKSRMSIAKEKGVPFTNYGVTISYITGILDRATAIFKTE